MKLPFVNLIAIIAFLFGGKDKRPEHVRLIRQTMNEFIQEAYHHYGVFCYGDGGAFMRKVNKVNLYFAALGPKNISEMRLLLITLSENYLKKVNSNRDLKKHLANYPFLPENLDFSISLQDKKGKPYKNKGSEKSILSYASNLKGRIFYSIENEDSPVYQTIHEETYEEALAIVQHEHPELFPLGN